MTFARFPFSMGQLPRHQHCGCFSLRVGCVLTALFVMVYTTLPLSQCLATISTNPPQGEDASLQWTIYITGIILLTVTFSLSAIMLVGVLRDKIYLIRPWIVWQSIQLAVSMLMFLTGTALKIASAFDEQAFILCAAEFLIILLKFYMLTVVASYSRMLEERSEEMERLKSADHDTWYTDL